MTASLALNKYQPVTGFDGDRRRVSVLGSTGTIGVNTLDLIERNSEAYDVVVLTANRNVARLAEQAVRHKAEWAVVADEDKLHELQSALEGTGVKTAAGETAVAEAAAIPVDWTMSAIVGVAGLRPTLEAVKQGAFVALANKECLVSAGDLFNREVLKSGATVLPVDSEHSAVFQCLVGQDISSMDKMVLTASGGPFRELTKDQLKHVTREQALKHPNWEMGQKITIDSATLMNKGLELIEAWHLFPVEASQLDVLVHPQSIIHCLVSYKDGSVMTQMGSPDMRTPIAYSLAWPKRMPSPTARLDLAEMGQLTFERPDEDRFPALRLAREVLADDGEAGAILNAANEVAVEAFLNGKISFTVITDLVEESLQMAPRLKSAPAAGMHLEDILDLDKRVRREMEVMLHNL